MGKGKGKDKGKAREKGKDKGPLAALGQGDLLGVCILEARNPRSNPVGPPNFDTDPGYPFGLSGVVSVGQLGFGALRREKRRRCPVAVWS